MVQEATEGIAHEPKPKIDFKALGQLGGLKGGKKARAEKLTSERRTEIAKKAAQARWGKRSDNEAR